MKLSDLLAALIVSLVAGMGVLVALNGLDLFIPFLPAITAAAPALAPGGGATAISATPTSSSIAASVSPATAPTSRSISTRVSPRVSPITTLVPREVAVKKGEDLASVLLLYDSTRVSTFDINFCKIAEYYGLMCKKIALDRGLLTLDLLRDSQGSIFKLIGINAGTLLANQAALSGSKILLIKSAVETGGANLFVGKVHSQLNPGVLVDLTDGAIVGVTRPQDSKFRDWSISTAAPEITREFTGKVISYTLSSRLEYALDLGQQASTTTLITSTNAAGATYPVFVRYQKGRGSIFVDSGELGESLEKTPLYQVYQPSVFSQVIPLMMTVPYALGDRAWHTDHKYANLTLDDPALIEPYGDLNYSALLREMQLHNYQTTIAFIPANLDESQPDVVQLFVENPDRYSLVQHGNNHDGYEFFKYSVSTTDIYTATSTGMVEQYLARPLADQESDIREGVARMELHRRLTGIPFDRIMVFPWGISPEPTLVKLKKYNYLATINFNDVPLDAVRSSRWDYLMYQANMDYGGFPSLTRRSPGTYEPFRQDIQPFIFDLFIGKPALFYSHAYAKSLFGDGIEAFNPIADRINSLSNGVEWRSLGHIAKHLYLERTNSDGSVDIKMYGNDVIITPRAQAGVTYHIMKEETLNVPIQRLTVNGHDFPYRIEENLLKLDLVAPKDGSPIEVAIRYAAGVGRPAD